MLSVAIADFERLEAAMLPPKPKPPGKGYGREVRNPNSDEAEKRVNGTDGYGPLKSPHQTSPAGSKRECKPRVQPGVTFIQSHLVAVPTLCFL
jgi:hypothetical protein